MNELLCTLVADGSSDRALIPILGWLLRANGVSGPLQIEWANLSRLPRPPRSLPERIKAAFDLYPCHLLFVHRDAERFPRAQREREIEEALVGLDIGGRTVIPVIPVKMLEAWLLFDIAALRRAAGNPCGTLSLNYPRLCQMESEADPKELLYRLLREASGQRGRKLKQLREHALVHRVAELIDDFSPLRELPAFQALEQRVASVVAEHGWT